MLPVDGFHEEDGDFFVDPEAELAALAAAVSALEQQQRDIDEALKASKNITQQNRVRWCWELCVVGYEGLWEGGGKETSGQGGGSGSPASFCQTRLHECY